MKAKSPWRIALTLVLFLLFWAASGQAADRKFGGVGLQVVPTVGGDLVVLNVLEGSPARAAGLKPGDLIVKVNDFPLKGSDFARVVKRYLWGRAGTKVTLKYLRPGVAGERAVTLERIPLEAKPARTPGVRMLTPKRK
jgi:carboxyl-terminal processing protease